MQMKKISVLFKMKYLKIASLENYLYFQVLYNDLQNTLSHKIHVMEKILS